MKEASKNTGAAMNNLTGKPAIPFDLPDRDGHTHRLDDYRGSWLLMVFHRHLG
jgi:peroxiredoxin